MICFTLLNIQMQASAPFLELGSKNGKMDQLIKTTFDRFINFKTRSSKKNFDGMNKTFVQFYKELFE